MSKHRLLSRLCFAVSFTLIAIAVLAATVGAAEPAAPPISAGVAW
jgi:hypothetical protein